MTARQRDDGKFVRYYAEASESPATRARFASVQAVILRTLAERGLRRESLDVLDVGCGAGTQVLMWARDRHRVHGIDINEALIEMAGARCTAAGVVADLRVGSATDLPWASGSMDVCIAPELLEHVREWQRCRD